MKNVKHFELGNPTKQIERLKWESDFSFLFEPIERWGSSSMGKPKQKIYIYLAARETNCCDRIGVYGNAADPFYISLEGDKYSICRLTFGSCPSEATNRAPPKTEIQFRTAPIPQALRRLMPALPKCPKSYWISGSSPCPPSYAFLYLTTSRQEIWMMYKGSVSNQFRIRKVGGSLHSNREFRESCFFFLLSCSPFKYVMYGD